MSLSMSAFHGTAKCKVTPGRSRGGERTPQLKWERGVSAIKGPAPVADPGTGLTSKRLVPASSGGKKLYSHVLLKQKYQRCNIEIL